jgi:tetratricopeptide (TPR) repeat protein
MNSSVSSSPLDAAVQLIWRKDLAGAEKIVAQILAARPNHGDALQLLGTIRSLQGRPQEAEQIYRRSLSINPAQPSTWLNLAHLFRSQQRLAEAVAAYRETLRLQPNYAAAQFYVAVALHESASFEEAEKAYRQALRLEPSHAGAMIGLGAVLNDQAKHTEAERFLHQAIGKTEDAHLLASLEYNLGTIAKARNDHQKAIAHFEKTIAHSPSHNGAEQAKADALQFLGRQDEAVESFRRAIEKDPLNFGAHRDLNQLLYRLKRDDEFLKSYDDAAKRAPHIVDFTIGKAAFLLKQEKNEEARELFAQAHKKAPDNLDAITGLAVSNTNLKNFDAALAAYEMALKLSPQQTSLLYGVAAIHLFTQAPKKAAMMAEYALTLAPYDQTSLAILGTAWRMQNDEREYILNGYDDFIRIYDLEAPEGYPDMETFNRDLNTYLDKMHPDAREYIDQSLRNGTQTLGNIFSGGHELVDRLKRRIDEAVARYIREMRADDRHPLLSRRTRDFKFKGSWSSRLRDCGYHTNHIHPEGWISSAYYVGLPDVADADSKAGWIKFGEPGYELGFKEPVRRAIQPRPGRLVLFPSYMWHGTVPFRSAQHRTTIAFDVVPGP